MTKPPESAKHENGQTGDLLPLFCPRRRCQYHDRPWHAATFWEGGELWLVNRLDAYCPDCGLRARYRQT